MCGAYLSEHLGEVVDVGGAEALGLEALGLQQVLGDVGRVDQHAVERALLVPVGLEHDLDTQAGDGGEGERDGSGGEGDGSDRPATGTGSPAT